MLPGPVFTFELLRMSRRKRHYLWRCGFGLLLLWIVWESYPTSVRLYGHLPGRGISIHQSAEIGRKVTWSIGLAEAVAVVVLTPSLVAGVIADEKQRKTLHYLLASSLTSSEIVLGKLASRLLLAAVSLVLPLPILALVGFLGGVDQRDIVLFQLACATTMFFLAAFSIAVSVHSRRPRDAAVTVYACGLVWLVGPTLARFLLISGGRMGPLLSPLASVVEWVGASSPFGLLTDLNGLMTGSRAWYESVFLMIALQASAGLFFAVLAVIRLRPAFREGDAGSRLSRHFRRRVYGRLFTRRPCGDHPLVWKETTGVRGGLATRALSILMCLAVVLFVGSWGFKFAIAVFEEIGQSGYFLSTTLPAHNDFNLFLRFSSTFLLLCGQLGAAAVASGGLTIEREEDTWICLIATPLTPGEIVWGKLIGALWSTRWIMGFWAVLVVSALLLGCLHPVGLILGLASATVYLGFSASLGHYLSLRSKTSARALTATVAILLVTNALYLIAMIPFDWQSTLPLVGVSPFVAAGSLLSYRDVNMTKIHGGDPLDFGLTGFLSLVLYGVASYFLTFSAIKDFDRAIDRPETEGGTRPTGLGSPGSEGIEFVEEAAI